VDSSPASSLPGPPNPDDLFGELEVGLAAGASDWQFKGGEPCSVRAFGQILPLAQPPLAESRLQALVMAALGSSTRIPTDLDATFAHRGEFFRLHTYSAGGVFCLNLRHIPGKIRRLDSLAVPAAFRDIALQSPRGLILVTGPTGSGKSTTLAAAIDHLNGQHPEVILTFEDPIEFRHSNRRGLVRQLQKGLDFENFAQALRGALRSDPDVILVGEMRDAETIAAALTAAETGHLVLGTLHCGTAPDAVSRIADAFPAERAAEVRVQLSKNLIAVLAQQLVRSRDHRLTGAFELMLGTTGVRHLIADPERKYTLLANEIATGGSHGMISMDQSLQDLCRRRVIERAEAVRCAVHPAGLDSLLAPAR
jgi:twitching motility protein PilT